MSLTLPSSGVRLCSHLVRRGDHDPLVLGDGSLSQRANHVVRLHALDLKKRQSHGLCGASQEPSWYVPDDALSQRGSTLLVTTKVFVAAYAETLPDTAHTDSFTQTTCLALYLRTGQATLALARSPCTYTCHIRTPASRCPTSGIHVSGRLCGAFRNCDRNRQSLAYMPRAACPPHLI